MPQRQGSGASMRYYSNIRAYLDLGFEVEVIQIAHENDGSAPSDDLTPVSWTRVFESPAAPSVLGKLMFRAGIPHRSAVEYYVTRHRTVIRELERRRRRFPEAIFHLEGEMMASVLPWIKGSKAIWSLHDLPSTVATATAKIACEAQGRGQSVSERREIRFAKRLERKMARHAPLVLAIADHDRKVLREEWNCSTVEYLPLSIPDDGAGARTNGWMPDGKLRLLHLGSVSHLPSYRSLEFIFERLFPIMPPQTLERIVLEVVGRVDRENQRTKRILSLAERFPNVVFRGFVDDVVPYYKATDLQIVASTDASGLRTRTIESFARGLPVLSSTIGAQGIANLEKDQHLLMADSAPEFAERLTYLLDNPARLAMLSRQGHAFYTAHQSQKAVAACLDRYLRKYLGVSAS